MIEASISLILDLFINKGINENRFSSRDNQIISMFVEETAMVVDITRIIYIISLKLGNKGM